MAVNEYPDTAHNPVPFDFVPFNYSLGPAGAWDGLNPKCSGIINYTLNIKTPLHIVGEQEIINQHEIKHSGFLRRHGKAVIPGSSIKGMLRAFMEALAGSWVSQATDLHNREGGTRTYAFSACSGKDPVIPAHLHPRITDNGNLDLASYLFGIVLDGNENNAFPSRFSFEDIVIPDNLLEENGIKLPDVPGKAFMGGPKPRINNWWYFKPDKIARNARHNTDFFGSNYWGRKFYYHQNPAYVLAWYADKSNWPHQTQRKKTRSDRTVYYEIENNYRDYPVETVKENTELSGKIYFENVPEILLKLVMLSLSPENMAHKLGYGQAFGLGSVKITLGKTYIRNTEGFDTEETEYTGNPGTLTDPAYERLIDAEALKWLTRILCYDENFINDKRNIYTYPLFGPVLEYCAPGRYDQSRTIIREKEFQKPVPWGDTGNAAQRVGIRTNGNSISLTEEKGKEIAEALWDTKKTIHFRLYQERSRLWKQIEARCTDSHAEN